MRIKFVSNDWAPGSECNAEVDCFELLDWWCFLERTFAIPYILNFQHTSTYYRDEERRSTSGRMCECRLKQGCGSAIHALPIAQPVARDVNLVVDCSDPKFSWPMYTETGLRWEPEKTCRCASSQSVVDLVEISKLLSSFVRYVLVYARLIICLKTSFHAV